MKQQKKLLLIDLDDTLADINRLKEDIAASMEIKNIKNHAQVYEEVKKDVGVSDWLDLYATKLALKNHIDKTIIKRILNNAVKNIKPIKKNLDYLKRFTGTKVIFSFGNKKFQKQKIKILGLQELVDGIIITDKPKSLALNKFIKKNEFKFKSQQYREVVFIDDRQEILDEVKRNYPFIKTKKA